jgi:hypothetical protein
MLAWMIQFSRRNVSRVISIATVASSFAEGEQKNEETTGDKFNLTMAINQINF